MNTSTQHLIACAMRCCCAAGNDSNVIWFLFLVVISNLVHCLNRSSFEMNEWLFSRELICWEVERKRGREREKKVRPTAWYQFINLVFDASNGNKITMIWWKVIIAIRNSKKQRERGSRKKYLSTFQCDKTTGIIYLTRIQNTCFFCVLFSAFSTILYVSV